MAEPTTDLTDILRWEVMAEAVASAGFGEPYSRAMYVHNMPPEVALALMGVAEAAEGLANEDHCDSFDVTEFGCTCHAHRLMHAMKVLRESLD